jgi:hypothetical protein
VVWQTKHADDKTTDFMQTRDSGINIQEKNSMKARKLESFKWIPSQCFLDLVAVSFLFSVQWALD